MKTIDILLIIFAILFIIFIITVPQTDSVNNINNQINNSSNELISFNLEINPSTGYHWEVSNETEGVKLVSQEFVSSTNNSKIVGAGGVDHFVFKKEGTNKPYKIILNKISPSGNIEDNYTKQSIN
mgnify:FL=1